MADDAFEDREKAFEAKFKLDQELAFKAEARRNRLLAEWLGRKFGLTSTEVEAYITDVVYSDLVEAGIEDVIRKVMTDIEKRDASVSEDEVRAKIKEFDVVARDQVMNEYPDALDDDHDTSVGD